jgi:DNA polymerase-3 subunit alpha
VDSKDLNKKSIEALAKVGAIEKFGERNQILASMENILVYSKNFQNLKNSNQGSLFGLSEVKLPDISLVQASPAEKKERLAWEKELLGLYITDHPAREYQEYFDNQTTPIREINSDSIGKNISVGGVISKVQKIYLKTQKTMLFVTIEDMFSSMEILVFPKILENTASSWEEEKIIVASGKISNKDGNFKLLCDSVKTINQEEIDNFKRILATQKSNGTIVSKTKGKQIIISLPPNSSQETLKKISQTLDKETKGETKVIIDFGNTKLETPYSIEVGSNTLSQIKIAVPDGQVVLK